MRNDSMPPTGMCPVCRYANPKWWQRPDGAWLCDNCHPQAPEIPTYQQPRVKAETEQLLPPEKWGMSASRRKRNKLGLKPIEYQTYFNCRLPTNKRERTGDGFLTICPFHPDTKPSLKVDCAEGVFYCHGCHAQGGVMDYEIKWAKLIEGLEISGVEAFRRIGQLLGRPDLVKSVKSLLPTTAQQESGRRLQVPKCFRGRK